MYMSCMSGWWLCFVERGLEEGLGGKVRGHISWSGPGVRVVKLPSFEFLLSLSLTDLRAIMEIMASTCDLHESVYNEVNA